MRLTRLSAICLVCFEAFVLLNAGVDLVWDPPTTGTPLGYNVYRSATPGTGFILQNAGVIAACSYEDKTAIPGNTYYYIVKSVSPCGTESQASNELAISVPDSNSSPLADAGPDNTVYAGQVVLLAGAGSDPDGDPLIFTWTQLSGPAVALLQDSPSSALFTAPSTLSPTLLVFRLRVSDGKGGSATDDVEILVTAVPVNQNPTAEAGPDLTARSGQTVTLTGLGADPDGDPISYTWQQVAGPEVSLSDAHNPSASFIAPDIVATSKARFRLSVSDPKGGMASDDLAVTLRPRNQKPKASAGSGQTALSGETIILEGKGDDPDGDPITYSWSQVSGPTVDTSNPSAALITFTAPESRETVKLTFELRVADSEGETASDNVDVTIRGNNKSKRLIGPANVPAMDTVFSDAYIAAAIVNQADVSHEVSVTLIAEDGEARGQLQLGSLPAKGQRAFIPRSLLKGDSQAAAMLFEGDDQQIAGMFAIGNGVTRLDGISGDMPAARQLYFPLMPKESEKELLSLFNAGDETAQVKLTLRDATDGTALKEVVRILPRQATVLATPVDLFGADTAISAGYIEAESDQPVTGFQVLGTESSYSSLAARPAHETAELWLPHFVVGSPDLTTTLRLLNAGTSARLSIRVDAYADDGKPIASDTLYLKQGQLEVRNLLSLGTEIKNRSGYLKVTANDPDGATPRVVGSVEFAGNNGAFASAVSLQPQGQRKALFPQIAQSVSPPIFTGLAILNPTGKTARVTVTAFKSDGTLHREISFTIERESRVVDLLNGPTFFGDEFEQLNGYVIVSSDSPLISTMLWGDYESTYLAAVEGQDVE